MKLTGLDRHAKITSCVFAALCLVLSIALLVMPKSYWSDNENRTLAEFPEFSAESLADGEYLTGVEDFLTDHFPMRDMFVSLNTRINTAIGRSELNNVFICDDGFLIDKYQAPARTEAILEAFNRLPGAVGERNVAMLIAPTAASIYSDKLPAFAQQADQLDTLRRFNEGFKGQAVDVTGTLMAHREEHQLYYRTDHHWTTYGAYYAYAELCAQIGLEAVPMESFTIESVTDDFCGTTYSKVNDFSIEGEEMHRFTLPGQSLRVTYGSSAAQTSDSLYNAEYLEQKDKYSYFLNNIHDLVTIENDSALTDRQLVLIKDSYANCFTPFLAEHFAKIYVVDLRHYRNSVIELINSDEAITDVLVLYNLGTMDTDTGVTVIY